MSGSVAMLFQALVLLSPEAPLEVSAPPAAAAVEPLVTESPVDESPVDEPAPAPPVDGAGPEAEVPPPAQEVVPPLLAEVPEPVDTEVARPVALTAPWSSSTAYVLPQGRLEVGVFQPLCYGLGHNLELSTRPLLDLLMPSLAVKKAWLGFGGAVVATRHNLMYPTGLLLALSREGTGGIIAHDTRVPHILALNNEVYLTLPVARRHRLTAKVGLMLAMSVGRSTLTTIDLPLVLPRTAAYTEHVSGAFGFDLEGPLGRSFTYGFDLDLFMMNSGTSTFAVESSGVVGFVVSADFRVQAGVKVAYSELPFGSLTWVLPQADLIWAF
ncbi:MAG: hypothetical protein HY903_22490 [Deltaproteobacteria bacterium]|nr:hypothetical protein [Deltaproteobacteria bacterium]